MGVKDRVTIELYVDDQGTVKVVSFRKSVEDLGQAGKQAFDSQSDAADNFAATLAKQVGIYALVIGAAWKLQQAAVGAFKAGIQAVDDYRLHTIGVAATLTDLADNGVSSQTAYARNIIYSRDMYDELQLAAARHFATGAEMIAAWNIMAQKGIVLQKDQIDNLGVIVDKVKLLTVGQVSSIQIAQELRAMLSGQSRATDQMAMLLKDRYGAAWEEIVEKHRKAGDLLAWLASEFRGLVAASDDIVGTYTAQKNTLETMLSIVGRDGLEGAYEDIVGWLKLANDYLRDHRETIGRDIANDWILVREVVMSVVDLVRAMGSDGMGGGGRGHLSGLQDFLTDATIRAVQIRDLFFYMAAGATEASGIVKQKLMDSCGPDVTAAFGAGMEAMKQRLHDWKDAAILDANEVRWAIMNAQPARTTMHVPFMGGEPNYGEPKHRLPDGPPPTRPGAGSGKGKKGGSGRDTTDTLENLILQLRQEQAKLAEGAFSGVDAAYEKTVSKIRKLAMDEQQLKEGLLAADEWRVAKKQRVADEFNLKYLGQMHQTTALQIAEDQKRLDSVKGNLGLEQKAREIMNQHALERSQKLALAELQQQKGYYDSLAASSILITDQIAWKEKSWQLEKDISRAQLEQWFIGKDITAAQKDNYRALLALTNQAKEYNLARQQAVDLGTLEGWAISRAQDGLKNRFSLKSVIEGSESFLTDAYTSAMNGALSQSKQSAAELGKTMAKALMLELGKWNLKKLYDNAAQLLGSTQKRVADSRAPSLSTPGYGGSQGGVGLAGLGSGGQTGGLNQAFKEFGGATKMFSQGAEKWLGTGNYWQNTVGSVNLQAGQAGMQSAQMSGFSAGQMGLSAAGLGLSAIGLMTGSQELTTAGMVLQAAALAIEIAALIMKVTSAIPFFHAGGMIAHQGLLIAHSGLALDERLILAQTGEGIIKRDTMAEYARQGISFDMLNSGRLPYAGGGRLAGPAASGNPGGHTYQDNRQFRFGDIHLHVHGSKMTPHEVDSVVRQQFLPSINKHLKRFGFSIGG